MNKVILMGRLTATPETGYTQGEESKAVVRYTLAVDRRQRQQDGQQTADFIRCVAWGKAAEWAGKWLSKGTKIVVTGEIRTGSYTNRDGQKVYTTEVLITDQEFAESKATSGSGSSPAAGGSYDTGNGFMNIPDGIDEELPFN